MVGPNSVERLHRQRIIEINHGLGYGLPPKNSNSVVAKCIPKNNLRTPYQAARLTLRTIAGFVLS